MSESAYRLVHNEIILTIGRRCVDEEFAQRVVEEDIRVIRENGQERLLRILVLDPQQLEALWRLMSSELAARVDCTAGSICVSDP